MRLSPPGPIHSEPWQSMGRSVGDLDRLITPAAADPDQRWRRAVLAQDTAIALVVPMDAAKLIANWFAFPRRRSRSLRSAPGRILHASGVDRTHVVSARR
ncbi:hypothetical protein GCM10010435_83590 [Winogradskya consettensis]|uniref:Uncharacterized protein n=1 Tax=Winogradskya consettensis TaxID=113560 RepID=A0A919SZI6_9ACTN|nr:hypothetical protein Aco04nite_80510 [Actinoplanes consettensis]